MLAARDYILRQLDAEREHVVVALASGATFEAAARLANYAGGLVVMKRGTATVNASELRSAVMREARSNGADRG